MQHGRQLSPMLNLGREVGEKFDNYDDQQP
jgi:hypothetical protein